jgi:hypothetical protein
MMSGVTLETFPAFNKLWNNKFYFKLHLVGISIGYTRDVMKGTEHMYTRDVTKGTEHMYTRDVMKGTEHMYANICASMIQISLVRLKRVTYLVSGYRVQPSRPDKGADRRVFYVLFCCTVFSAFCCYVIWMCNAFHISNDCLTLNKGHISCGINHARPTLIRHRATRLYVVGFITVLC